MPLPAVFDPLRLPVIAAPMFLVSGPELVIAACQSGIVGTFPALNARPIAQLDAWLSQIDGALAAWRTAHPEVPPAPYGVNLILHPSNQRLAEDAALMAKHRVPLLITSLGHPGQIVQMAHEYGGLVFADVIHAQHARKAIAAGVDGIIAIAAGAGGHAGSQSPFALIREIREFWDGPLVLGGAISDGYAVRAAEVLGADLAYMGTRFIATREAGAAQEYKDMLVNAGAQDIVYTDVISGANANFLWPSLERAGYRREDLHPAAGKAKLKEIEDEAKAWRDTWSAGHGVAVIHDQPALAELVDRLASEYAAAGRRGRS